MNKLWTRSYLTDVLSLLPEPAATETRRQEKIRKAFGWGTDPTDKKDLWLTKEPQILAKHPPAP